MLSFLDCTRGSTIATQAPLPPRSLDVPKCNLCGKLMTKRRKGSIQSMKSGSGQSRSFDDYPRDVWITPCKWTCARHRRSSQKCHKRPSSALSRLLAHIEKCTIARAPHRERCMSGEGISTLAH